MAALVVGVSGNVSRPSKTRALVEAIVERVAVRFDAVGVVFDVVDLAPSLGGSLHLRDLGHDAWQLVELLHGADALVVASPVYKGSYTGLFKHLFDLIDPAALIGKPVLVAATGGGDRHALVVEHQMRPLLGFFEAATLATGVYACERDFTDGKPNSPALFERMDRSVAQFAAHLGARKPTGAAAHRDGASHAQAQAI